MIKYIKDYTNQKHKLIIFNKKKVIMIKKKLIIICTKKIKKIINNKISKIMICIEILVIWKIKIVNNLPYIKNIKKKI